MILSRKPLTLGEVKALVPNLDEKLVLHDYIKKFSKLSGKDSEKLCSEIRAINNPKLNEESIIKIADFLPKDSEDINKILFDVSLTEEESNAILNIVKNY